MSLYVNQRDAKGDEMSQKSMSADYNIPIYGHLGMLRYGNGIP